MAAYLRCTIGAKRIDHDNLIAPAETFETGFDTRFFVITNDDGGYRSGSIVRI
jgi:hypothetical protein